MQLYRTCLYRGYCQCKLVIVLTQSVPVFSMAPEPLFFICLLTFAFLVTGTIQVAQRLDRDAGELRQNPIISLEVLVRDRPSGGQENRMQITIIVEDINDNPATCRKLTFR